jgi:hypothetical protein
MHRQATNAFLFILMIGFLSGCVGARTFHEIARAGDTVAVAAGWKNFSRDNITVTITPSTGIPVVYGPGNPAVRAVINLYPDPISSIVVSTETGQDLTPFAQTYGGLIGSTYSNGDKDWWQTTVFIDLPAALPVGSATIDISGSAGGSASSTVEIVAGTGTPNSFYTSIGPLGADQLAAMERVGHNTIKFYGSTIPYAIQVGLAHDPDVDHGGSGRAYVVNPRGDLKNIAWSDDGTNIQVILSPTHGQSLNNLLDFKFYVAGGVTNLRALSIKAVDINGNALTGVSAVVE